MPTGIEDEQIRRHLRMAESHVTKGEALLARQRSLVESVAARGGVIEEISRQLLNTLEESQARHIADRDRLRRLLRAL